MIFLNIKSLKNIDQMNDKLNFNDLEYQLLDKLIETIVNPFNEIESANLE